MHKPRIVYTGSFDPLLRDGVSSSIHDLFRFLNRQGYEVYILSLVHSNSFTHNILDKIARLASDIIQQGKNSYTFVLNGIHIYYEILPYSREEILNCQKAVLEKYLEKIAASPQSIFFSVDCDLTTIVAHSLLKTRAFHYIHSPAIAIKYFGKLPFYLRILKRRRIFTVSQFARNQLSKLLEIDATVWPPFIDVDRFRFPNKATQPIAVGFYSAGPHKGSEIVARIIQNMPETSFVIMGHTQPYQSFPNATLLGSTTRLGDFYEEIVLLLVPSVTDEGYPRVILEAAFNGVPVIANRVGGIPEALGESGILIDVKGKDMHSIASEYIKVLKKIQADPHLYAALRKQALERAADYKAFIQKTSAFYASEFLSKTEESDEI